MRALRLAVASFVLLSAAACSSNYSSPSPSPTPAPSPAPGPVSTPASSTVTIPVNASTLTNTAFAPDSVDVAVGATVTWTNTDGVAHTSTSDARVWDSGIVPPGGKFSVVFPNAGTFSYHCAIHPGMIGTVVVH